MIGLSVLCLGGFILTRACFRLSVMSRCSACVLCIQSSEEAVAAINDGKAQLEILKRQVVLGQMYPSARSVME